MNFREAGEGWKSPNRPDWDQMFAGGDWEYLDDAEEAPRYAVVAGYVNRRPGAVAVLDVGCGSAVLRRYLDHSRVQYLGIDVSQVAVEQGRARMAPGELRAMDIAAFEPSAGQFFDIIVFNEVLPHLDDPLGVLERHLAYLQRGGIAVVSTYQNPNPRSNAFAFRPIFEAALEKRRFRALGGCEVLSHANGRRWSINLIAAREERS